MALVRRIRPILVWWIVITLLAGGLWVGFNTTVVQFKTGNWLNYDLWWAGALACFLLWIAIQNKGVKRLAELGIYASLAVGLYSSAVNFATACTGTVCDVSKFWGLAIGVVLLCNFAADQLNKR